MSDILYKIASKAEYISEVAHAIADGHGRPGIVTDALLGNLYRDLCDLADNIDELCNAWDDDKEVQ